MSTSTFLPTIADIRRLFEEEATAVGASSTECYEDDHRLFARVVVGAGEVVQRGDVVRGGVALYASGPRVQVHPYTWRQVCTNGAISASATGTFRVDRIEVDATTMAAAFIGGFETDLRHVIRACTDPSYLTKTVEAMRVATTLEADMMIGMMPRLLRMTGAARGDLLTIIMAEFEEAGDRSVYGLMNAVTAVARDVRDPAVRWRLEEAGGELMARVHALASSPATSMPVLASA